MKKETTIPLRKSAAGLILGLTVATITLLFGYLMLERSTFNSPFWEPLTTHSPAVNFLNIGTLGVFWAVLLLITNRFWLATFLSSGIFGVLAIINFFVIHLHGMPLSFLVLKNFQTAMNVIGGINFVFDPAIIKLILIAGVPCILSLLFGLLMKYMGLPRLRGNLLWLRNGALLALCTIVIYSGYLSDTPIKPSQTITWSWRESYLSYGYAPCTIESFFQMRRVVNQPEHYNQEDVNRIDLGSVTSGTATPDIILILNETFYDLSQVTDVNPDIPYMQNIETMDNLLKGYAITVSNGGGTNSAEYELLTSNSMWLMPGVTPFNSLDLNGANSIVSHLNALGYDTSGSHSESHLNYSRGVGYSSLGFDHARFNPDFTDRTYYDQRQFETDESLYKNLIRWYEEAPEDSPRFSYLLTIQNHSQWEANPPESDIVHTTQDFGEITDQVDEFLSCMYLSDIAFKDLTDYFAQSDRPVIICMVGDHSPYIASSVIDSSYSYDEAQLRLRKCPLLIWANFPLEEQDLGTMSMNMVVPTLLDIANAPLSPYYSYMLQLKQYVPILTAYGKYYDAQGGMHDYSADTNSTLETLVDNYFNLEYQSIETEENRDVYLPIQ